MACIQYILLLGIVMSPILWSRGGASQLSKYNSHNQQRSNQRENLYNPGESHEFETQSGNEPPRNNERSILTHSTAQGIRLDAKVTLLNQSGSYKILNGYSTLYVTANRRGQIKEPTPLDKVIFPGPTATYPRRFVPEISEECMRVGICDSVPNYPDEHVANIIAQLGPKKQLFQLDELDTPEVEIVQRLGPSDETIELCDSHKKIMYPQAVKDKEGEWHMAVNPEGDPVQGFIVEVCKETAKTCAPFVSFESGYEPMCVQKFVNRKMQVLNLKGNMVEANVPVPSCCACLAKIVRK